MELGLQGPRSVGYLDLQECERQARIRLLYVYDSAATSGGGGGVPYGNRPPSAQPQYIETGLNPVGS